MPRLAWILAAASLLSSGPALAAKFTLSTGVFGVNCTSSGQLCAPPETLPIGDQDHALKIRKIVYTASAAHCSAGRLHVALDGKEVGRMRFVVGREQSTLKKRIRVKPGSHTLAFSFEGRVGGCNQGAVSGWGGTITVYGRRSG